MSEPPSLVSRRVNSLSATIFVGIKVGYHDSNSLKASVLGSGSQVICPDFGQVHVTLEESPILTSWYLTVKQNNFTLQRLTLFEGGFVTV